MNEIIKRSTLCHNKDKQFVSRYTLINHGLGERADKCVNAAPANNVLDGFTFCGKDEPHSDFVLQGSMVCSILRLCFGECQRAGHQQLV